MTEEQEQYVAARAMDESCADLDMPLLEALVENSSEVIAVLSHAGVYLYVSPSAKPSLGWAPAELLGRRALDIVHPDDAGKVGEALTTLATPPHTPQTLQFRFAQSDGQWRHMESSARAMLRPGKPLAIIAHTRDITEQMSTHQALRDSEERYRQLIDNSPDAIIAHSNGIIVFANSAAAELFGSGTPEELIGHSAADIIHPDDLPGMRERVQKSIARGRDAPLREERMVRLDGSEIWVEAKGVLTTINGKPAIQAVIRDITQRRNALIAEQRRSQATRLLYDVASQAQSDVGQQLQQSLALTASLLDMESGVISECDDSSCYVAHYHGPADSTIKGESFPLDQTYCSIPMTTGRLVAISDLANSPYAEHAAVKNKPQKSYIGIPLRLHNGQRGVLGFNSTRPREKAFDKVDGDLIRIMSRWVEFALARKSASQALEAANLDLSRSNEELQQFAYIASHDLKEPLRAVTTYLQLLKRRHRDQLSEEACEFMDFAVTGATRMQNIIQDLLEFSRVGAHSDSATSVSLDEIMAQAIATLADEVELCHGKITVDPLPTINAHQGLLLQLMQNLIGNAIKYRRPEIAPIVHITGEPQPGGLLRISVRDNGIGIALEHRERIFQMFRRLHNHEEYEGTGIGLALAKRIVERHGGNIGIEDAPEGGSCFYFTLPTTL